MSDETLGRRTVYFGNLAWSVSNEELAEFAKECGEVEQAEVLSYRDGRKTGSGIVRYVRVDDAQNAIKTLSDKEFKGRVVFCREDKEGGKGPGSVPGRSEFQENRQACQVYVGNLTYKTSWQDLKDHFSSIGDIEYCDILADRSEGYARSAGAGLIRFKTAEQAKAAIETMTETELQGRKIFVREDREGREIKGKSSDKGKKGGNKKGGGKKGKREYAIRIPAVDEGFTWKDLKDGFSRNGHHPTHTVVENGSGVVKFASESEAQRACEDMWQKQLGNTVIEPEWF